MQVAARKASSSAVIVSETNIADISQNTLNNQSISTSPSLQTKTSKVSVIGTKSALTKPVEITKENDLARLLAAYGDCV
jgi:hypothetical protein